MRIQVIARGINRSKTSFFRWFVLSCVFGCMAVLFFGCSKTTEEKMGPLDSGAVRFWVFIGDDIFSSTESFHVVSALPEPTLSVQSDPVSDVDFGIEFPLSELGINSSKKIMLETSVSGDFLSDQIEMRGISLMNTPFFYLTLIPELYDVDVALMGDGIDLHLPWLQPFVKVNEGEVPDNGIDDDDNGVIDDVYGASKMSFNDTPTNEMFDSSGLDAGHDTPIAAIIASKKVVADSSPNSNYEYVERPAMFGASHKPGKIKIVPIRFEKFSEQSSEWAINYAVSRNVDIVSASFGMGGELDESDSRQVSLYNAYERAMDKGVVIVASSGNSSTMPIQYPCAFSRTICVGGLDPFKGIYDGFSIGSNDFMAYGLNVNITTKSGGWTWWTSGPSYAAPQITAAIAKIMSYTGNYDRDFSFDLLKKHSVEIEYFKDLGGNGYIDYLALARELVDIEIQYIKHPELDVVFEVVFSRDKASKKFLRGFVRYVYFKRNILTEERGSGIGVIPTIRSGNIHREDLFAEIEP